MPVTAILKAILTWDVQRYDLDSTPPLQMIKMVEFIGLQIPQFSETNETGCQSG